MTDIPEARRIIAEAIVRLDALVVFDEAKEAKALLNEASLLMTRKFKKPVTKRRRITAEQIERARVFMADNPNSVDMTYSEIAIKVLGDSAYAGRICEIFRGER